jgi:hypothetical protein
MGLIERRGPWTDSPTLSWSDGLFGVWLFERPDHRLADIDGIIIAQDPNDVIALPGGHLGNGVPLEYLSFAPVLPVPAEMLRVPA